MPSGWHTTFGRFCARRRTGKMAVRIKLSDGDEFAVHMALDEVRKAFREALDDNRLFELSNGDGRLRVINPHQILYFEEDETGDDPDGTTPAAKRGGRLHQA